MTDFFVFCTIVLSIGIIKSTGTSRLIVFMIGIIFFQERITLFNFMTIHQVLVYMLIVAEIFEPKPLRTLWSFPMIKPLIIVFLGILFIGMLDGRHSPITNMKRITDSFSSTFFITYLFYTNFKRSNNWNKLFNFFLISSIILCIYGLYNFFTKSNPYDNLITNTYHSVSAVDGYYKNDDRFRISSFVFHPIYYGYLLSILFLLVLSHFMFFEKLKSIYFFTMMLILSNLVLTNSRTPLLTFFLGVLIYVVLALKPKSKLKFIFYGVVVCLIAFDTPIVKPKINSLLDIFQSGGEKTNGSSVDMRTIQLKASYAVFLKKPILGNGLSYIVENMGFDVKEDSADSDFKGFESYIYQLLIEQGLVGIITNVVFFLWFGLYFFTKISTSEQLAGFGIALLVMFIIFSISTGTLGSWIISMGLLGILVGSIVNFETQSQISNNDDIAMLNSKVVLKNNYGKCISY